MFKKNCSFQVVAKFAPRREEECSAVVTSQEILENDKSLDNANSKLF